MKTYLFNAINKYKKFSETYEVKKAICDKVWLVFNDSGEKELYIFQEDGTLYITLSGKVSNGTWQYIPANKSIIISANKQSYMVHANFMDGCIFALQIDGTEQYAFLIDEQNKQKFLPRTFSDIINYFTAKEQKYLEEQQRSIQEKNKEKERLAKEQEHQREAELRERAEEIEYGSVTRRITRIAISIILYIIFAIVYQLYEDVRFLPFDICNLIVVVAGVAAIIYDVYRRCKKWEKEHPDDPVNKYLLF